MTESLLAATEDFFGAAVSLVGDSALVGAWGDTVAGTYSGSLSERERLE